jgi:nickel-dependent lactate racemase
MGSQGRPSRSVRAPALHFAVGSPDTVIGEGEASALLDGMLGDLGEHGPLRRVLLVPPDITRLTSGAGELTGMLYRKLAGRAELAVMPALGTHVPMSAQELSLMYPGVPPELFRRHDWRNDVVTLGELPSTLVREVTEGKLGFPIACAVNRSLLEGGWDRIISVGQLVPHELAGIASHSKNILVGLGGGETIGKSHLVAAVYGLERLMGQAESPMRRLFRAMEKQFLARLPITYLMTVRGTRDGLPVTRGLYAGSDEECYLRGAELARAVSITTLARPARTIVAYMDGREYHATWVANKAIYRTRMALADGGRLVVMAPGVSRFGEDDAIDAFIRRVGYRSTAEVLRQLDLGRSVPSDLTAASHLIVSSPEGRFRLTYAAGGLSRSEVESVGLEHADCGAMLARYPPELLREGFNTLADGEEVYFVPRPASGLWTRRALGR